MKTDAGNGQLLGAFNHASILKQTLEQSLQITTFSSCSSFTNPAESGHYRSTSLIILLVCTYTLSYYG
jgi:hypothetical protein